MAARIQAIRGMHDTLPEQTRRWQLMEERVRDIMRRYGYDEIRMPIVELAQQLDPQQFVQVHRSTLVNMPHLAGTRRDETSRLFLRLRGHAQQLPVSRAYVHLFKAM